ncbi:hypothetical protein AAY473_013089 [Plecturocebus cupreus]
MDGVDDPTGFKRTGPHPFPGFSLDAKHMPAATPQHCPSKFPKYNLVETFQDSTAGVQMGGQAGRQEQEHGRSNWQYQARLEGKRCTASSQTAKALKELLRSQVPGFAGRNSELVTLFGRLRWVDHLRPGVRDYPHQYGETLSLLKYKNQLGVVVCTCNPNYMES